VYNCSSSCPESNLNFISGNRIWWFYFIQHIEQLHLNTSRWEVPSISKVILEIERKHWNTSCNGKTHGRLHSQRDLRGITANFIPPKSLNINILSNFEILSWLIYRFGIDRLVAHNCYNLFSKSSISSAY
jgi:hypothetical protein